jgi:hypothetical protein
MLRKLKFAGEVLGLLVLLLIFWAPLVLAGLLIRWFPSVDGNLIMFAALAPVACVACYIGGRFAYSMAHLAFYLLGKIKI